MNSDTLAKHLGCEWQASQVHLNRQTSNPVSAARFGSLEVGSVCEAAYAPCLDQSFIGTSQN